MGFRGDNACFAWWNGDSRNGGSTRDSYNVSGFTDHVGGDITITFNVDPENNDYVVFGTGSYWDAHQDGNLIYCAPNRYAESMMTTSGCRVNWCYPGINANASLTPSALATAAFIGDS